MHGSLNEDDIKRYYNIYKIYLNFLGEDVTMANRVKDVKEYHTSTASKMLKEIMWKTISVLSSSNHIEIAKGLGQLFEQTKDLDDGKKSTFETLLVGLENFRNKNILVF